MVSLINSLLKMLYYEFMVHREYMLAVLLHMTQELLKGGPPSELESTLGGNLAGSLLKVHNMHIIHVTV